MKEIFKETLIVAILIAVIVIGLEVLCQGSDAKISFELAVASMKKEKPKVPQSQCTTCKGTGRVKSGDTIVVTESDCPDCYPDPQEADPTTVVAQVPKETVDNSVDSDDSDWQPDLHIKIYTMPGCPPCIQTKRAAQNLIDNFGFNKADFKITGIRGGSAPQIAVVIDGKERHRTVGGQSATQLSKLYNQWYAIATADKYYKEYKPKHWKEFCKKVDLAAYVRGMTLKYHITEHHGKYALKPEQLDGLTNEELIEIHGWQHTHKDIE